ncbi:MAG TPA: glycosyltransferase [Alphaproteobacteria bacterium]|nr:glycosyltransferase [Alphaproteobacteria bacterium]
MRPPSGKSFWHEALVFSAAGLWRHEGDDGRRAIAAAQGFGVLTTLRVFQAIGGGRHGGAETFFIRLAIALQRAGLTQRVAIRRDAIRAARLAEGGVDVREFAFGGAFDMITPLKLARAIREFQPTVVLSWMSRATAKIPPKRLCGVPFVHVARLGGFYGLKYYRRCDHLVGITREIVEYTRKGGWPSERTHYLPNFADVPTMTPVARADLGTPSDAPLALALGRLHRNKAFDVLLRALALTPGLHLWIAGEGPARGALEALIRDLSLGDRVRLLGWRDDVAALLPASDFVVFPSRHEPFGTVTLEAWAAGRALVAAATYGPAAVIEDGVNGLLVPVDDHQALAAAMTKLCRDVGLRQRLAAGGRKAYEAEFTEAAVVRNYMRLFEEITA